MNCGQKAPRSSDTPRGVQSQSTTNNGDRRKRFHAEVKPEIEVSENVKVRSKRGRESGRIARRSLNL